MLGKRKAVSNVPPPKKKRKQIHAIEEIKFDPNAREDYLAGFHKRKLQRSKHAREEATKREREAKIEARKMLREGRKADLEKHVKDVNAMLRQPNGDEASESEGSESNEGVWEGIVEPAPTTQETEYMDDDRFTTVTVEAVDISREGFEKAGDEADDDSLNDATINSQKDGQVHDQQKVPSGKRVWTKERPGGLKKKKKKFRYESKAERKVTRYKEKSHNKKQARDRKS